MMKQFFCLIIIAFFCLSPLSGALAQTENAAESASGNVTVNTENIDNLIETLESEQARQEFIDNLKILRDASEKTQENSNENTLITLSNKLGLEDATDGFIARYEEFLEKNNLNSSILGKILITIVTFLVTLLIYRINSKIFSGIHQKLEHIKKKYSITHDRFRFYTRMLRYGGHIIISLIFAFTLLTIWDLSDWIYIGLSETKILTKYAVNILFVIFVALLLWELINSVLEYSLRGMSRKQANRVKTIIPIVRNIIFVVFASLFTLVILSELGINIMPLLAGAGIFGIALGFGAQAMVKDFLNGFTIILEDLIQVGDVAKVGDRMGVVEKITTRKVQLRDITGIVYTVPHGEIKIIENWTKDFSYYVMDIGVAYREEIDEVVKHLEKIDDDLRKDEKFKTLILEPLEILGVDKFADSAVIIKARIKTKPTERWTVGREFNRRMKHVFDKAGIEMPFPHQTIYFGEDKKGSSPPAHIMLQEKVSKKT